MIRSNFKLAARNLMKDKFYSFINIFGLGVGLATSLVLWTYIQFELNYDSQNQKADVLYRITTSIYSNGEQWPVTGYDLGPSLQNEIPEIKAFMRTHPLYGGAVVSHLTTENQMIRYRENSLLFADSTLLTGFTFHPVFGDLTGALTKSSSVVITRSMSEKYFGKDVDPTGRILRVTGYPSGDFQVTAVVEDVADNAHLTFDFLLSMRNLLNSDEYRPGRQFPFGKLLDIC